ncbi:N-succinylarginine dihydrolase [Novosphingobium piscinae]|uniref:N-succinylarginine dihydrolase n=1 Tax=Novosphingobium piscinae TaxID=1507448 RepID=A0A7X1FVV8_9SPHN|nr:N-succinylarginine dihydrolase [Novosphingobium piscinae]
MDGIEINFDGLIGPSHNYAGLSLGNVASARNAGAVSRPRAAALQGLAKMRRLMELGLPQGFLPPPRRPHLPTLHRLGFGGTAADTCAAAWRADPGLFARAASASAMWTANAATVSPAPDTADGRCHLTVANLATMAHRSLEAEDTLRVIARVFGMQRHFAVHPPVPASYGDEGAANHMRLTAGHGAPGIELFVYGEARPGGFPARQDRRASEAVARLHGLDPARTLFIAQSRAAIDAGAFHNDVVAVANERVLLVHEQAFADQPAVLAEIARLMPEAVILEVPAAEVSLADAIGSYLFNSQIVTLPTGAMALIVPAETQDTPAVRDWLARSIGGSGPIDRLEVIDVRESMRNGGGPACLRLRVVTDAVGLAALDPAFVLTEHRWSQLHRLVETYWPEAIDPAELGHADVWQAWGAAYDALDAWIGAPR